MYIEQLTNDDFNTLAIVFTQNIDTNFKTEPFNNNSVLIKLNGLIAPQFVLSDFDVSPSNKSAVEFISAYNVKQKYYKYMVQKFGPKYYEDLMEHLEKEYAYLKSSLN
jgi:hypothetical protein